jgi:adenylate cyclase
MDESSPSGAWLESCQGEFKAIEGTCYFGRSPSNDIALPQDKVSRRHALINIQGAREYWLVDLGSSNGTYLNGRRINQPCQLRDMDRVEVGGHVFVFRNATARGAADVEAPDTEKTIQDIKSVSCWLLVADIEGSTQFIQKLPVEEAPKVTAGWLAQCRRIVERHRGTINKFLGDGFLAYWADSKSEARRVADTVEAFRKLQNEGQVRFRQVLHWGPVFVGGGASLGEESLLGNEVNFVFRMEKVAAALGVPVLLSQAAADRLGSQLKVQEELSREVPGFKGEFKFYVPADPADSVA